MFNSIVRSPEIVQHNGTAYPNVKAGDVSDALTNENTLNSHYARLDDVIKTFHRTQVSIAKEIAAATDTMTPLAAQSAIAEVVVLAAAVNDDTPLIA